MSKVPELDLHDDDVLELTDVVEPASTEDDFSADSSDLDLSFEQELEDLFSDTDDENKTQAPPAAGDTADDLSGMELETGDTIDLSGFEIEGEGDEDVLDLVEPLETTDFSTGDDDLAATTVLSSRDQNQDLDDLDDLESFDLDSDEGDDLAATTVISGQGDRVADVGDFDLEAEDELTLDLGDDDDSEDQADAFVEDEDFDISGLDELLGADEGAADDIGPMDSTADIDEAELELEEISLESTGMQARGPSAEPEGTRADTGDLDVLGLEDLISDLELPDQESTSEEPVGEFNMSDFVEDEGGLEFEDITEPPVPAETGASEDLIDLEFEDIVEAGQAPAEDVVEPARVTGSGLDFGDDLVDLSDTFDESLGGIEGLEGVMEMGEAEEAAAEEAVAEEPAEEWDIELSAAELVSESEEDFVEEAAVEETAALETEAEAAALEEELTFEGAPAPAEEEFSFEAAEPEAAEEEVSFEEPAAPAVAEEVPAPPPPSEAAPAAPAMDHEAVEQVVSTLEAMETRIKTLESAAAEREALADRVASLESELNQVNQSAGSLEQSIREAMQKLDTNLGENGAVAAMVTQRLDEFRQGLETREPAKDEALEEKVQQLEAALEQARADQAGKLDQLEQKAGRLDELDGLAARLEQVPSADDLKAAAVEAAQSTVDEKLQQAVAEGGEVSRSFGEALEKAITDLRAELSGQIEAVKKTAEDAATSQPDEEVRAEAVSKSVREELDKELAEGGSAAKALRAIVETAVTGLRTELSEQIESVKKTAEDAAASQPDEEVRAEAVSKSVREELDKELAEGGSAAKALRETVETAVTGLRTELSEQIESVKKTAEDAVAGQEPAGMTDELRASLREEMEKALAEGGVIASRIDERIGAMEESARLDNMALESRLSQAINQFGDPDSVPEPVINAISSGIVEAMDEGGPFHSRLEERIAQVSKERQGDLESLANRLEEVLKTFRDEGVSREDVESMVGDRLAKLEDSLRGGELGDKVSELVEAGVAKEGERLDAQVEARMKELGKSMQPSADELRAAASQALEDALPQFRASLVEELETRLDKQPLSKPAQDAIADAVETRMRDSLAEDSDIYENLVGNLTEQLERVIREGVESLERKTVSHEDWNVMAARLRQEMTAKIESESAKAAARIIREEITSLLGED